MNKENPFILGNQPTEGYATKCAGTSVMLDNNYTQRRLEEFDRLNPKPTRDDSVDDEEWEMIKNGWEITIDFRDFLTSSIAQAVAEEREEVREKMESALEDYFNGRYPIPDHKVISGYLREALSSLEPLTDK